MRRLLLRAAPIAAWLLLAIAIPALASQPAQGFNTIACGAGDTQNLCRLQVTLSDASGTQQGTATSPVFTSGTANTTVKETDVSVASTATAVPTTPLTSRRAISIVNNGANTIFCGDSSVTSSTGTPVLANGVLTANAGASIAFNCITASSTSDTRVLELS